MGSSSSISSIRQLPSFVMRSSVLKAVSPAEMNSSQWCRGPWGLSTRNAWSHWSESAAVQMEKEDMPPSSDAEWTAFNADSMYLQESLVLESKDGTYSRNTPTECRNVTRRGSTKRSSARRQRRLRQSLVLVGPAHVEDDWEAETFTPSQCSDLMAKLDADSEVQTNAVHSIRNLVWTLSTDKAGCRLVQHALQVAPRPLKEEIVSELHGHVLQAVDSPHANYVIQLVVEVMPTKRSSFVAEEIAGVAARVARHRHGCRVIIRLLEHSATEASVISLVEELLLEAPELLRHSYGHFVLQAVLEHGIPCHKHSIAMALHGQDGNTETLLQNAMNRHGSTVFETALMFCSAEDTLLLSNIALAQPSNAMALAYSQFGYFVLKALLARPDACVQESRNFVCEAASELEKSKQGRKLLEHLGFDVPAESA